MTLQTHKFPGGQRLEIIKGDITQEHVDAIVNAANSQLQHGAGVAGAIVRNGGQQVQKESNEWVRKKGPVSHSKPAYTTAGDLPARYIIHAVGPVWGSGNEDEKLENAIYGSFQLASTLSVKSISFPAISTGIFGFPIDRAARIFASTTTGYFMEQPASPVMIVRFVLFDQHSLDIFIQVFKDTCPVPPVAED